MEILLPSLKERKEDIVPLAKFLLEKIIEKYDRSEIVFEEEALDQIGKHSWNGNIREMENRIERAVILCENNQITISDLDLDIISNFDGNDDLQLSEIEKSTIEKVLQKNNFNISKSADELGLSRASLYRRMEKFDLKG